MLSQNSSFYVTLPSNGSKKYFPENKTNSYKNHLAREIRVDGDWEVALTEVHYPQTVKSMDKIGKIMIVVFRFDELGSIKAEDVDDTRGAKHKEFKVPIQYDLGKVGFRAPQHTTFGVAKSLDTIEIEFPIGRYSSPKAIVDIITTEVANKIEEFKPQVSPTIGKGLEFGFDTPQNKFYFNQKYPLVDVIYYKQDEVCRILGLPPPARQYGTFEIRGRKSLQSSPELNTVDSLYIYTDVIENDLVGDTLVPLLRTVDISGEPERVIHEIFTRFYYKRVNRSNIPSIEIQINSETGKQVKFESGHVICVLHFRKVTG